MRYLTLLFAHLVADYPLQGQFLSDMKGKNNLLLASHAGIWTGVILATGVVMGRKNRWHDVLLLFGVHALADAAKSRRWGIYQYLDPLGEGLALDQAIHAGQLAVYLAVAAGAAGEKEGAA